MTGQIMKVGLALGLGSALIAGSIAPTYAGDAGSFAAGAIGGAALGALAGSAAAGAYGPPPGYYAPPPRRYVEPIDVPPPRCHRVITRRYDPYAGEYVERVRRVCEEY